MCYDTKSSLIAWIIAVVISLFLIHRNRSYDRWNAGFILVFSSIQLFEGGLWSTKNQSINSFITKIILVFLLLQPLMQTYLGAKYTKSNFLHMMIYIYFAIILYGLYRVVTSSKGEFYTNTGEGGHLIWNDKKHPNSFLSGGIPLIGILYFIGLFLPLMFAEKYKGIPLLLIGLLTLCYSLTKAKKGEFSSLWCYYSVIYAVVALFV